MWRKLKLQKLFGMVTIFQDKWFLGCWDLILHLSSLRLQSWGTPSDSLSYTLSYQSSGGCFCKESPKLYFEGVQGWNFRFLGWWWAKRWEQAMMKLVNEKGSRWSEQETMRKGSLNRSQLETRKGRGVSPKEGAVKLGQAVDRQPGLGNGMRVWGRDC